MNPTVTVVIATYNYSNVLKYALQSVLWQTFQDFEVWVIGDACTDDSEVVVASFADPRIHWHNLSENSGSQSMPNNAGIERAQGKYIAYLGHDDLWYPTHLELLVEAMEREIADVGHTLLISLLPNTPFRVLYGLREQGQLDPFIVTPPSSLMHRRDMVADTGLWKEYGELRIPPDTEFVARAALIGKRFCFVPELTVFKFPSSKRLNVYKETPSHEQAEYTRRIQSEPDFQYRELLALIREPEHVRKALEIRFVMPLVIQPGEMVTASRKVRGLDQRPVKGSSLAEDLTSLVAFNPQADITPDQDRHSLHTKYDFPINGVLLGDGWHGVERDVNGHVFRWVNTDAQIFLTNPDGERKRLSIDVWPGYANKGQPVTVSLVSADGSVIGEAIVETRKTLNFDFTPPPVEAALYTLQVSNSLNLPLPNDPRILNFAVSKIRLSA